MNGYYAGFVTRAGATPGEGDCATGPPGERAWNDSTGRVVCVVEGAGPAFVVWTHDDLPSPAPRSGRTATRPP